MQKTYEIPGVSDAVARDAWWFGDGPGGDTPWTTDSGSGLTGRRHIAAVVLLILMADVLFWRQQAGASLAIFALAVFGMATLDLIGQRRHLWPAVLAVVGSLPVVDMVQPLSVAFLVASLLVAVVWARFPSDGPGAMAGSVLRLARQVPLASLVRLRTGLGGLLAGRAGQAEAAPTVRALLRNWGLPVGGTLVFAALLVEANPLMGRLLVPHFDLVPMLQRGLFWLGVGLMVWPLIDPAPSAGRALVLPDPTRMPGFGLNAASVLRALVMFNLMIGVQTLMDASILIGGADLPPGMSYATYARRGAYPLLVTAMLAGAFALSSRPFLDEHRAMRPLLFLWLGQNVALSASALMRLELYVDAYGLTYLRIYAMIWMGLVAAGLALTGWQVWRARANGWLMARVAAFGVGTIYFCAFVNFAEVVAERNLSGPARVDLEYLCNLGPMAAGPLIKVTRRAASDGFATGIPAACLFLQIPSYHGWRDFSFRAWRVQRYVALAGTAEPFQ